MISESSLLIDHANICKNKIFHLTGSNMKYFIPLVFAISLLMPAEMLAQQEIARERISLQGLQEFGFSANIQGSRTIAEDEVLTPANIRQQAINQLIEADLRYVSDDEVRSSADIPFLYMHINTIELENGLIPFSIQLRLYQPVILPLNRNLHTSASTWEVGTVGIVSYDRIPLINEAARDLITDFINDYNLSN